MHSQSVSHSNLIFVTCTILVYIILHYKMLQHSTWNNCLRAYLLIQKIRDAGNSGVGMLQKSCVAYTKGNPLKIITNLLPLSEHFLPPIHVLYNTHVLSLIEKLPVISDCRKMKTKAISFHVL